MFSVLLSVYAKEKPEYLSASLKSIIEQTLVPNEIVLVKDGPLTQELEDIISIFQKKYSIIKVVALTHNQGLGKALNEGLKYCSYNLVARMDTDDIAKNTRFEKQIQIFTENPDIDICSSWIEEFEDTPVNILAIKKLPENHNEIIKYAKHRCPINHPAVMYKKDAVISAGGYEGFPEDYTLWIKMIMNNAKFYNIQESLLFFRFSSDVIKRRGGWKYAIDDIKSQNYFYQLGFLSLNEFIYNIFIRCIVRLIPTSLRSLVYQKILRK